MNRPIFKYTPEQIAAALEVAMFLQPDKTFAELERDAELVFEQAAAQHQDPEIVGKTYIKLFCKGYNKQDRKAVYESIAGHLAHRLSLLGQAEAAHI